MKFRKPLRAILVTASLAGLSFSQTGTALEITINKAPPPAKYEVVPPPRKGFTWIPGYWDAKGGKHAWNNGHWEQGRAGHHYVEPRWVQKDNGWTLEPGRWNPGDRDGDGAPNSLDRQPDNPNRK